MFETENQEEDLIPFESGDKSNPFGTNALNRLVFHQDFLNFSVDRKQFLFLCFKFRDANNHEQKNSYNKRPYAKKKCYRIGFSFSDSKNKTLKWSLVSLNLESLFDTVKAHRVMTISASIGSWRYWHWSNLLQFRYSFFPVTIMKSEISHSKSHTDSNNGLWWRQNT
jgi:hypothetical protein